MEYVSYEDFKKLDMRIGWIRHVEAIEGADKLLRFEIDFGEQESEDLPFGKEEYQGRDVRQIVSGLREAFPDFINLVGKRALYVVNLEPRTIRGVESHGMLMAVDGLHDEPIFLIPEGVVAAGSAVR